ncbi:MAG: hypothetical protein KAR36_09745 [Candidatus Latescibacteria bacterium]|nr:hypothetical protein [Candidatus Latescibacterota bacterium]
MRICIDSNQFIFGISGTDPASETLLLLLPNLEVVLPRLVVKEVTRNLNDAQAKAFHSLLSKAPRVKVIDELVPPDLVAKYVDLGLPEKADALIGAFVEWQGAGVLISDNRHFLSDLAGAAFEVLRPDEFIRRSYRAMARTEGRARE